MRNKSYLTVIILFLVLISIGIFNTYNFWFNSKFDTSPMEAGFSFICCGLSSLLLGNLLTYIFAVPRNIKFDIFTLTGNQKWNAFKNDVGEQKAIRIKKTNSILFLLSAGFIGFCLVFGLNNYEEYQLENFGKKQEIEITNIYKSLQGHAITNIEFKYEGKVYHKELFLDKLKLHEKVEIIFSANDPRIAMFNDKFILDKE
ncbi:MAG: hypothetical protein PHT07_07320 [Paludibacter sp.]|nr:hypothetical protein [Paludibacter sp.]